MARKLKAEKAGQGSSGPGHNSKALTDEEHDALLHHHLTKLRAHGPKIEEALAAVKELRKGQGDDFRLAKNDLGYSRKELEEVLADTAPGRRVFSVVDREKKRFRLRKSAGVPVVGYEGQGDLFDHTLPMEARNEIEWESEGFLAGRRGDDPTPPADCDPRFHGAFTKGWHVGQAQNAPLQAKAQEVLDRKKRTGSLEPEAPPEEPDIHEQAAKDAKRLKNSDWMQPGPAETEFEAA